MRVPFFLSVIILLCAALTACGGDSASTSKGEWQATGAVELVSSLPHEGRAWTEGLLVSEGVLWESTGLKDKSQVRGIDMATGDVLWSTPNDKGFFGEGLVRAFDKTYLLTYTEGDAYLFDREAAEPYSKFASYDGQGWGLTANDDYLINSNGSEELYYRDPKTFAIDREVAIAYEGEPVEKLNELEFDGTYIWANQWQTNFVYRIKESDPSDIVRFELPENACPDGNPNGIAYDAKEDVFYLTGQQCPQIWKARFQ